MKLTDVITLAKQGFTASDIKELLAVKEEEIPPADKAETIDKGGQPKPDDKLDDDKPEQVDQTVLEEIAALKEQVKAMQAQKIKEPIDPPKKDDIDENELLTNFFK